MASSDQEPQRHDSELHDLAGCGRIRDVEINSRDAAAERLVRPDVAEHVVAERHVREVDDDVCPLGGRHQQTVSGGRDVDRSGQEPTLVADLPDLDSRDRTEIENQEARVAPVQEPEAVASLLNGLERPRVAIHHIVLPKNSGFQIGEMSVNGLYGPRLIEEGARVRIEQRTVAVERAVLDGDRDLVVGLVRRKLVVLPGRRAREHGGCACAAVQHFVVACGPPANR